VKYFTVYNDEVLACVSAGCQKKSIITGLFDRRAHPSILSQKFGSYDVCDISEVVLTDEF